MIAHVRNRVIPLGMLLLSLCARGETTPAIFYPGALWQHRTPSEAGVSSERLKDAVDFAIANEVRNPRDLAHNHYQTFGREPFGYAIGPIKELGDPTGLIMHRGYIIAEWGEPARA